MDIPRGHAMLPLTDADFLDFIYNYFKSEYSPIKSIWSTATAIPNWAQRWEILGSELSPLSFRPANAQAQKDLDSLDYFIRKWKLDSTFVKGIVVRFSKYQQHERLEKKLYECCRVDLMVRKALREKHLIDGLWPSPAPSNLPKDTLQQGVQVRRWYGDMFMKYYQHLHSVEDFSLKREVDAKIKAATTLMLVPFSDHLVNGIVEPIVPIVATGLGYENRTTAAGREGRMEKSFGEPERFEVRFDAPTGIEAEETFVKNVTRQCRCVKCGSKRDVNIKILVDPSLGGSTAGTSSRKKEAVQQGPKVSKTAVKYSPGYSMPGVEDGNGAPLKPPQRPPQQAVSMTQEDGRPASPQQKKQCPACTFLNHPDLTACEMCTNELPSTVVAAPDSPPPQPQSSAQRNISHSHSASLPPPTTASSGRSQEQGELFRPRLPNRQSLGSTLFSIFPFSQQQQDQHHANLPATQPSSTTLTLPEAQAQPKGKGKQVEQLHEISDQAENGQDHHPQPAERKPSTPPSQALNSRPQMAMMPLTPPPTSTTPTFRNMPPGLPQNLMDGFVPVSSSPFLREQEEEDAGWGEMSREEVKNGLESESDGEDEERGRTSTEGMIDLDAVAREEMGVWGERED